MYLFSRVVKQPDNVSTSVYIFRNLETFFHFFLFGFSCRDVIFSKVYHYSHQRRPAKIWLWYRYKILKLISLEIWVSMFFVLCCRIHWNCLCVTFWGSGFREWRNWIKSFASPLKAFQVEFSGPNQCTLQSACPLPLSRLCHPTLLPLVWTTIHLPAKKCNHIPLLK